MDLLVPGPGLLVWTLIALTSLIFWIIALISIAKNDFESKNAKLLWIGIVILGPIVGSIVYFASRKRSGSPVSSQ